MRTLIRLVLIAVVGGLSWTSAAKAAVDCSAFPEDLLQKWGLERQLVLNLVMARGRNLETMRKNDMVPDPATFRTMADAFEGTDFSGVEPMDIFDTPEVIVEDLRKTADLLEAALAAGGTSDPAWTALSEFYSQRFYGHHNSSIAYWLTEAGCA